MTFENRYFSLPFPLIGWTYGFPIKDIREYMLHFRKGEFTRIPEMMFRYRIRNNDYPKFGVQWYQITHIINLN